MWYSVEQDIYNILVLNFPGGNFSGGNLPSTFFTICDGQNIRLTHVLLFVSLLGMGLFLFTADWLAGYFMFAKNSIISVC